MHVFLALMFVAAATAELAPLLKNSEPIPGKYIIKLRDDFNIDEIASTVRLSGGKVGNLFRNVLHGFAAELSDEVLDIVRGLRAVEYVEQDGVYRTQVTWGLDRIDQRSLPLDNSYSPRGTGSGYTVWVIDTGVRDTHNDFGGRAKQVVNYAGGSNDDCNGHGTHCAGTVGSNTYGVATKVSIKGVKVLNCLGSGSNSGVISGVDYVKAKAGSKDVASMSLGGGISTALDNAVKDLISSGVPTAVAAGNDDANACYSSPARASTAITVGATDSNDKRSSFSNYGNCLDIFAPGTSITSTWYTSNSATRTISGTSMACPHVAGAITLYSKSTSSMLASVSSNKISDVGSGSPNKLLYV
ncbi:aqualysin-1-like [Lytechinus variegatus]|uniref:aqualysin-1-like n=1 Tax=Lytechinus variegatus TaxID=7654 RepID=UPI001BB2A0CD|nr:aqualysin-1-like [Lytechinus variegatus]XP_041453290.1 aqualysin-1-like [Lytechinus variegatus]